MNIKLNIANDDLHGLLFILFLPVSLLRDNYYTKSTKAYLLSFFFFFSKNRARYTV